MKRLKQIIWLEAPFIWCMFQANHQGLLWVSMSYPSGVWWDGGLSRMSARYPCEPFWAVKIIGLNSEMG